MRDKRDLRDPAKLGEALLEAADHFDTRVYGDFLKIVDSNIWNVPDYAGYLMGHYTAEKYIAELQERTETGDVYAKSTLEAVQEKRKHYVG